MARADPARERERDSQTLEAFTAASRARAGAALIHSLGT
jgi:hypothetical protein